MVFVSILTSIVVAISGPAVPDPTPVPRPLERIGVISSTYEIDFPNEIKFRLDAESDSRITEVTLFYRVGPERISTYGYPQFSSSKTVNTEFTVKTGGASFIPSGVDIEYHYLIRTESGQLLETESQTFEYLDPAYDWRRYETENFALLYHDRSEREVAAVAEVVDEKMAEVKDLLGLTETNPMKAVIFNDSRESSRSFPLVSDAARAGHLFGGFAYGRYDVFILGGLNRDGIIHEMTHLMMDEALSSPLAQVPAWLNEGLAMYFETGGSRRQAGVSQAARRNGLFHIDAMGSVPGRPQDVRVFYAQSWSIVTHMMNVHGAERMSSLLDLINRGQSVEDAVSQVYGLTLDELEQEWFASQFGGTSLDRIQDPGQVGTSVLIAAAATFTAVVMLVRWMRNLGVPDDAEDADM